MAVTIVTDSASGIPLEEVRRYGIRMVPLSIAEGGDARPETGIDVLDVHRRLSAGPVEATTSQPSPADFARAFQEAEGDVVAVLISGGMSSTLDSAGLGAAMARDRGCANRIEIVDSRSNSMQEGFAVLAAARCAAEGGGADECREAALASVARSRFLFAPERLDDLVQGGRIAGAVGLVGSLLRIVPILTAADGATGVAGVARSRAGALARMVELMKRDIARAGLARVVVQWIADEAEASRVASQIIAPIAGCEVPVVPVPASIAVHVGPALGLTYETVEPLR